MDFLWHFRRCASVAFRELLDGDLLLFEGDDGGSDDGGDSQGGGDADGGGSRADDDGAQGGDGDENKDKAETVSGEEYRKKLAENKALRKRAKKSEEELAELRKRDESEQQQRDRELEEQKERAAKLEAEARELRVQVLAPKAGILPEAAKAAYALISWDDVDVDDEKAVVSALKALKEDQSFLFKSTDIDAGSKDRSKDKRELPNDASPHQRLSHAYAETK